MSVRYSADSRMARALASMSSISLAQLTKEFLLRNPGANDAGPNNIGFLFGPNNIRRRNVRSSSYANNAGSRYGEGRLIGKPLFDSAQNLPRTLQQADDLASEIIGALSINSAHSHQAQVNRRVYA